MVAYFCVAEKMKKKNIFLTNSNIILFIVILFSFLDVFFFLKIFLKWFRRRKESNFIKKTNWIFMMFSNFLLKYWDFLTFWCDFFNCLNYCWKKNIGQNSKNKNIIFPLRVNKFFVCCPKGQKKPWTKA